VAPVSGAAGPARQAASVAEPGSVRRRRRTRRAIVAIVAAVVVIGVGGGVALARSGSSGPAYRLATVTRGSVTQTVSSVGTIQSVNRATVTFPVAGTVASVAVRVGSRVTAGDALALLSMSGLTEQVQSAQAAVAKAQQTLAADTEAQLTGASSTASGSGGVTTSGFTTQGAAHLVLAAVVTASTPPDVAQAMAAVQQDQTAVVAAQQGVDRLLTQLAADIQAEGAACRPLTTAGPSTGAGVPPGLASQQAACQAAITTATNDQAGVPEAKSSLAAAESSLTADLVTLQAAIGRLGTTPPPSPTPTPTPTPTPSSSPTPTSPTPGSPTTPRPSPTRSSPHRSGSPGSGTRTAPSGSGATRGGFGPSGAARTGRSGSGGAGATRAGSSSGARTSGSGSSGSRTSGSGSGSGSAGSGSGSAGANRPITAEQLAADQAQVDAAQANLVVAQQNAAQGTLRSPITGTVAAVGLTVGSTAGTSGVTVIGTGNREVSTTVTLADVDQVAVGDVVTLAVDGVTGSLTGRVTAIGVLNTTTGTSTSYPVTVLLDPTTARVYDGLGASVSITTSVVNNVLTVPTSAVRTTGALHLVTVLKDGKTATARVTVGAVGLDRTQVMSGLTEGQRLVLADLGEPLPTSGVNARRFGVGGTGGLTGR
jgi:multidrug efflux pump subunit AcrA (membrane-fusion protein)